MKTGLLLLTAMSLTAQERVLRRHEMIPREQQTGKASIEGNVLDAATREPVKKATVSLNGIVGLSATTDAAGHFAFRDLPAGKYVIIANSEKYPRPRPGTDVEQQVSISLAAEDQRHDIGLTLTPGASVRGRVLDDEGSPMQHCSVSLMRFQETDDGRTFAMVEGGQSDDHGEYRISNVARGKYYVMGRCFQTIPLPHALIQRGSTTEVPVLTYAPQFYPGVPDPTGATKIEASPNANITGIDLRMLPAKGITVRGHIGPSIAGRPLQVGFQPRDPMRREWQRQNPRFNSSTGEFQIPNVAPGSYELVAGGAADGATVFARVPVEVGEAPLEPMEVTLNPALSLSGTISAEGDLKLTMSNMRVSMRALERPPVMMQPPQAEVKSDGTFTLSSIVPGRWRLFVTGIPGYVKSVTRGDQEVSPFDLEVGQSAGGPLKIVLSTVFAQAEATISSPPSGTEQTYGLVWSARGDPNFRQTLGLTPQSKMMFNVPPGKYYACAVADGQPWMLLQNRAVRKALEGACQTVDIAETGRTSLQLTLISAQDLKRMMDKVEE